MGAIPANRKQIRLIFGPFIRIIRCFGIKELSASGCHSNSTFSDIQIQVKVIKTELTSLNLFLSEDTLSFIN